jgi:nicotinamidase-related amidase
VPRTALLVIDMLNTYDHPDADRLTRSVERALPAMRRLLERAHDEQVPTIYVNDSHGQWRSNSQELVDSALGGARPDLIEPIAPGEDAMFVVKARHSAFFQTPLEYLLSQEDVDEVVLTGQVTEQCILYSALDAYIRHLSVVIPRDAVAHIDDDLAEAALRMMELNMDAAVVTCDEVHFRAEAVSPQAR